MCSALISMVNRYLNHSIMKLQSFLLIAIIVVIGCKEREHSTKRVTAFTGATLIDGSGSAPISDGVLLVTDGRVLAMGSKESVAIPGDATVIDVAGKFIVPGIINTH